MGAADRLTACPARVELAFVQVQPELAQCGGHPHGAPLAVAEELGEPVGEDGVGVVDEVAEDVQFAGALGADVDCGDLDRGDHAHALALPRRERLGDAAHGVVV